MSTRSFILMEKKSGGFKGVYAHWDGYPSWNGKILVNHYQDESKLEKLISLGSISVLDEEIEPAAGVEHNFENHAEGVTVFYGRDRGETGTGIKPKNFKTLDAAVKYAETCWCEYAYVRRKDGTWMFRPTWEWWKEDDEGIAAEHRKMEEAGIVDENHWIKLEEYLLMHKDEDEEEGGA